MASLVVPSKPINLRQLLDDTLDEIRLIDDTKTGEVEEVGPYLLGVLFEGGVVVPRHLQQAHRLLVGNFHDVTPAAGLLQKMQGLLVGLLASRQTIDEVEQLLGKSGP